MTNEFERLDAIVKGKLEFKKRYKDLKLLGEGGMGKVFFANDRKLEKPVAIKILHSHVDSKAIVRFQQEARVLSRLDHQYIVKVLDFGFTEEDELFLALEYVEGESLESLVEKQGAFPVEDTIRIASQLCEALEHAHGNGVIHRDLKPSNIIIDKANKTRILDFGIAKLLTFSDDPFGTMTRRGDLIGTPLYMSPEQVRGDEIDHRIDIYGLGMLLYVMSAGRAPWESTQITEIFMKKMQGQKPPSLRLWLGETESAHALDAIVAKAMMSDPDMRYQNMSEFREALLNLSVEKEVQHITTHGVTNRFNWKNATFIASMCVVALVAAASMAGFLYITSREGEKKVLAPKEVKEPKRKPGDLPDGFSRDPAARDMNDFAYADTTLTDADLERLTGKPVYHVSIRGNHNITEKGMIYLSNLPRLQALDVSTTSANDETMKLFAEMGSITWLKLASTNITNQGLKNLAPLGKRLKRLNLDTCKQIDEEGLKFIIETFPNLEWLNIGDTRITKASLKLLPKLKHLTRLGLSTMDLRDDDLKVLYPLKLELIDLTNNRALTDKTFTVLKDMPLGHIEMVCTQVSQQGIAKWEGEHPGARVIGGEAQQAEKIIDSGLFTMPEGLEENQPSGTTEPSESTGLEGTSEPSGAPN